MPSPAPSERPDIFRYDDFRRFLKDLFAYEKALNPRFSLGVFSRRAGVSRSHFKVVTDYRWKLSDDGIRRYALALRLSEAERGFFRLLVRHNQEKDPARREEAERELKGAGWTLRRRVLTEEETRAFLGKWSPGVVLGLAKTAGFRADPRWISRRMGGRLTVPQAAEALDLLTRLGLIRLHRGRVDAAVQVRLFAKSPLHDRLSPWVWKEGARRVKERGEGASFECFLPLPREKVGELRQEIFSLVLGAIQRNQDPRGELCVFLGGVFPLTGPSPAVARRAKPRRRR